MFSGNIPKKGISLFLITVISSFAVIIYLYAWDYQNKMNENSNYQPSWLQESSFYICPLH
ncbi:MAG: hypothetical protein MK083_05620 [Dehalococcoidia bacterium]|nr:hypothetical protein [Dehalococcoidia bacterium]